MHFVTSADSGRATLPSHVHLAPGDYARGHHRTNSSDSHNSFYKFGTEFMPVHEDEVDNIDSDDGSEVDLTKDFLEDRELTDGHDCRKEGCHRVIVNVSGMKFETQIRTLNRLPNTLLGDPKKRSKYWDPVRHEYFFDRHRPSFPAILYFYQSGGRLERPIEVPSDIFLTELQFFEMGKSAINMFKQKEGYIVETETIIVPKGNCQRRVWELFEVPESSLAAKIMAFVSVIFILVSVVVFCVETLPDFQGNECINISVTTGPNNATVTKSIPNFTDFFFIAESICIAWFVFELITRFISSPSKFLFVKSFVNWIDFLAIIPYFIFMGVYLVTQECSDSSGGLLSVLRVLRVTRILKLSKHSEGLKIFGKTMQSSVSELIMFALFLGIGVIIYAGAIYYAELQQPNTHFKSIPDAFWWAVVSMTTVGYGDVYPQGFVGKLIGSLTVLSGLLAIALPVPVIVTNFNNFYQTSRERNKE